MVIGAGRTDAARGAGETGAVGATGAAEAASVGLTRYTRESEVMVSDFFMLADVSKRQASTRGMAARALA